LNGNCLKVNGIITELNKFGMVRVKRDMYIKVHLQSQIKRDGVHHHLVCLPFLFQGSDNTMSLDGHDKLCGFQNSMFPLCIYGAQDTFSSRIQFLGIWLSNNNPQIIGRFYFDYLLESRGN